MTLETEPEQLSEPSPVTAGGNGKREKPTRTRRSQLKAAPDAPEPASPAARPAARRLAAEQSIPYVMAYGNITKALQGISAASTPDRFTQDFLATKLALKGGSARAVIPFLKRVGFLNSDGTPADLYRQYKNPSNKGQALAAATRHGYKLLYEVNEYAHDLKPADLKGVVLQVTGLDPKSSVIQAMVGSFQALKADANFEATVGEMEKDSKKPEDQREGRGSRLGGLSLGYTINLHLPPTSDIAVFNAIFKSLKEHLLDD